MVRMLQDFYSPWLEALGGLRRINRAYKCVFDATAAPAMLEPGGMDARTAESPVISQQQSWLQRERASGRFYDRWALLLGLLLVAMLGLSGWLLTRNAEPGRCSLRRLSRCC